MRTYPIMLNLRGRKAVVVGAGPVGLRKAESLAAAGAEVKLIADRATDNAEPAGLAVLPERYRPEHLTGAAIVFACTDDRHLNLRIAADARRAGAMVNVADEPTQCDFLLPAAADDGEVVVAVGTGGSSPALAAALRDRLAAALPERIGEFAAAVAKVRDELKNVAADSSRRHEILRRLAGQDVYSEFLAGGVEAVRRKLKEIMRES
ncbi:MAG: precorrin-2 dehydrogenase/sirohydrochlorin ferrochelatase family protein [Planctomycetota bacterium]|jgi:precorrin-2 dehydrogenase/sirohydrochlorin ferrochelatase